MAMDDSTSVGASKYPAPASPLITRAGAPSPPPSKPAAMNAPRKVATKRHTRKLPSKKSMRKAR